MGQASDASLAAALVNEFHSFIGFFVSFWVISVLWMQHHRMFRYIKSCDGGLIRLNLVLLFFVVLIPFALRVLNYGFLRLALDVFASVNIGASLTTSLIWWYASRPERHMLYEDVSHATQEWLWYRGFIAAGIFVVSIFLAFVNPYLTLASWLLVFPIMVSMDSWRSKRNWFSERK